jgi:Domain of unknown function (DUF4815)
MSVERYYNLYNQNSHYTDLMFRAGDGLQSRELNEMQSWLTNRIASVAGAIFKDGDITQGADIIVNPETGLVRCNAGTVYVRGAVRTIKSAEFTIPTDGRIAIGLRYVEEVISELEDPILRDPAVGTRNYQEPGALRRREQISWGWQGQLQSDGAPGQFYSIYNIINGILENRTEPPALDSVVQALARYDREANGSYITTGLKVNFLSFESETNEYILSLSEGSANVNGFKVQRQYAERLRWQAEPTLRDVTSEPHQFIPDSQGQAQITLNRGPIDQIKRITATKENTQNITHGSFTGISDPLPHSAVIELLEVKQGTILYRPGVDFTLRGDEIDWSLGGAEPAPGSSYSVRYRHIQTVQALSVEDDKIRLTGIVANSTVFVDYSWKMPRIDMLTLDAEGKTTRLFGRAAVDNPQPPPVPAGQLEIATVRLDFRRTSAPIVRNGGVRVIPMAEIDEMKQQIASLYDLVALERLKNNAAMREPVTQKGVFVDPFFDDDQRDGGLTQTAAIVGGVLTLPILPTVYQAPNDIAKPFTLDYRLQTILEQPLQTGMMRINPYQAFDRLPAEVTLTPPVDKWSEVQDSFSNTVTELFSQRIFEDNSLRRGTTVITNTSVSTALRTNLVTVSTGAAQFLRQIRVGYDVKGFGPGELLDRLLFDGVSVTPSVNVADNAGRLLGNFQIPPNVTTGTKLVQFLGRAGSQAEARFIGEGIITRRNFETRTTIRRQQVVRVGTADPLAQTFTLPQESMLGGVDLWFKAIGNRSNQVRVQIRHTQTGLPNAEILSEAYLDMANVNTNGPTRIEFAPVLLEANREYALVILTADDKHALAIAELNGFDKAAQTFVTRQPYQVGVLLASSNASSWTPVQQADLTFRLLGCEFTTTQKLLSLGKITLNSASELLALADVERISAQTNVDFVLRGPDNQVFDLGEQTPISLNNHISGEFSIEAILTGTSTASPILFPGIQAVAGNLQQSGTYVSRAIIVPPNFGITVTFDCFEPGVSAVKLEVQTGTNNETWQTATLTKAIDLGEEVEERSYKLTGLTAFASGLETVTRLRLTLTGTPTHRPQIRNLRAVIT